MSAEENKDTRVVRCPLCGYRYRLDRAERACDGCPMAGGATW